LCKQSSRSLDSDGTSGRVLCTSARINATNKMGNFEVGYAGAHFAHTKSW